MTKTTTLTHENPEWVIMAKALRGELSAQEQQEFKTWLEADENNSKIWAEAIETWGEVGAQADLTFSPDVEAAWDKVSQKLELSAPVIPITTYEPVQEVAMEASTSSFYWTNILKYAAIVLVAAGLSWVGYLHLNQTDEWAQVATMHGERKVIYLPDSSQVTLNANSSLRYQTDFNDSERNVELTGEAFFDVRRNPEKPFVIASGDAKTTVLGTSFNVRALPHENVKVSVRTGKVSLSSISSSKKILLTPGLTGTLSQGNIAQDSTDETATASWRILSFNDQSLQEVAKQINSYFDVKLQLSGENLHKCTFTGTFEEPNLKDVLKVLAASADIQITTTDQQHYFLRGRGCN